MSKEHEIIAKDVWEKACRAGRLLCEAKERVEHHIPSPENDARLEVLSKEIKALHQQIVDDFRRMGVAEDKIDNEVSVFLERILMDAKKPINPSVN